MEVGQKKASSVSSMRARGKGRKMLAGVNSTMAATSERASSVSSERARQKWRKLLAGINSTSIEVTVAATSERASSVSSERARKKRMKLLAGVNSTNIEATMAATSERASSASSERAREKWRKLVAGVNSNNIEVTVAATSERASSTPSERAREKWKKLLAGVNSTNIEVTVAATSERAASASSERARDKKRKLLAGVNGSKIEATMAATSGSSRFSSPASAANVFIRSDEIALLLVNQVPISTEESICEIQPVVTPPGTSPETQYYSCTEAEQDNDDKGNCKVHWRRNSSKRSISIETDNFSSLDVQRGNAGNENGEVHCRRDGSKQKVLEWIFAIANFVVELLSIAFDQLSSNKKPVFMPVCMGMSILAVLLCLSELVYKIRKGKAIWQRKGVFPWFYHPSGVPFGSFADVIGLACASGQSILTSVNYSLFLKHGNIPIKVSIWPGIFAFGQLAFKMWGEFKRNVDERESSSTEAGLTDWT